MRDRTQISTQCNQFLHLVNPLLRKLLFRKSFGRLSGALPYGKGVRMGQSLPEALSELCGRCGMETYKR